MVKNRILNIDILSISMVELLQSVQTGVIFTPNVDDVVKMQKDEVFYQSFSQADWIVCDSKILGLAGKFLKQPFREIIPGSSLLPAYYNFHKKNKKIKIFLLGSAEGVALRARRNINEKVGWNMVVGAHSPSYGFEKNESECSKIIDIINDSGANVLVVGVGSPKEKNWIMKYKDQLTGINVLMGLGATIDFEAGFKTRAPDFFQKLHLEWLYRLIQEPKRLWKRYLIEDIVFFWLIVKQKLGTYRNPFPQSSRAVVSTVD